ncbi:MAG TPA: hypothetical protein VG692_01175, partial [Gemmatimonadales bacterium]|nr:hypothetical protein [Gemmatimonadales bacterium]
RRVEQPVYDSVATIRRQETPAEAAWARLIRTEAKAWAMAADSLRALFDHPRVGTVRVVLGNRGAEDAFTHDSTTIGMDLSALQRVYGDAGQPENRDRVNRFFRHEFVHTLQKRWLARHPYVPRSHLETALLDAWAEGLGNYFSLSSKWRPAGETPSAEAARTLAELEPRLVGRLAGLACADSTTAPALLAGLSSGPFTRKWGAVPVALWLLSEETRQAGALHDFAIGGPGAFWSLALRHLPAPLADSLSAIQRTAASCGTGR